MSNVRPTSGPKKPGGVTPITVTETRSTLSVQADRVGGAAEPSLPEVVADHGNGTVRAAAAPVVKIGQRPSEYGRHAERLEHGPARPDPIDEFGFAAGGEIETIVRPRERTIEELRPLVDLIPNRIRPGSLTVSGGFDELNEAAVVPSPGARAARGYRAQRRSRCWRQCQASATGWRRRIRWALPTAVRIARRRSFIVRLSSESIIR